MAEPGHCCQFLFELYGSLVFSINKTVWAKKHGGRCLYVYYIVQMSTSRVYLFIHNIELLSVFKDLYNVLTLKILSLGLLVVL